MQIEKKVPIACPICGGEGCKPCNQKGIVYEVTSEIYSEEESNAILVADINSIKMLLQDLQSRLQKLESEQGYSFPKGASPGIYNPTYPYVTYGTTYSSTPVTPRQTYSTTTFAVCEDGSGKFYNIGDSTQDYTLYSSSDINKWDGDKKSQILRDKKKMLKSVA